MSYDRSWQTIKPQAQIHHKGWHALHSVQLNRLSTNWTTNSSIHGRSSVWTDAMNKSWSVRQRMDWFTPWPYYHLQSFLHCSAALCPLYTTTIRWCCTRKTPNLEGIATWDRILFQYIPREQKADEPQAQRDKGSQPPRNKALTSCQNNRGRGKGQ